MYLSGRSAMRLCASASISSRVPYSRASAGHAFTQAGVSMLPAKRLLSASFVACPLNEIGSGCATRSEQCVHFEILGASEFHSAVGTSQGHASWQYRQPMHSSSSYLTGPSGILSSAVVGHAETQAGSRQ